MKRRTCQNCPYCQIGEIWYCTAIKQDIEKIDDCTDTKYNDCFPQE